MNILKARIKAWERRGVYDDPRLTELSKMYEELGFTVKLEPVKPEMEAGCTECIKDNPDKYKVLYTKK